MQNHEGNGEIILLSFQTTNTSMHNLHIFKKKEAVGSHVHLLLEVTQNSKRVKQRFLYIYSLLLVKVVICSSLVPEGGL